MLRDRVARAVIGPRGGQGVEIERLRMAFRIEKSATRTTNKTRLTIYNLSDSTRAAIRELDDYLLFYAGYSKEAGALLLAAGDVSRAIHRSRPPNWLTEISADDGMFEIREIRVALAYDEGATCGQIIQGIADKLALPLRSIPTIPAKPYVSGFSFIGRAADALDRVTERAGLEWSIQSGELQIVPSLKPTVTQTFLISPGSGMIGSPEALIDQGGQLSKNALKRGYKVRCYLNPALEPGAPVQIKSRQVEALCRIESLTHQGDTRGPDWFTESVVREID